MRIVFSLSPTATAILWSSLMIDWKKEQQFPNTKAPKILINKKKISHVLDKPTRVVKVPSLHMDLKNQPVKGQSASSHCGYALFPQFM